MGDGPRGLQRGRRGLGLPAARPRPLARAYRWGEDGLAGFCDVEQRLCLGLALWNGRDPILKERMFGLTGARGEPRRGRQGVLVVPGRAAQPRLEPVALPLPAGTRSPTRTCGRRTAGGASSTRSTSCWTPGSSTTTGTGSPRSTTPRPTRTDLLMAVSVTNAGPGRRHPARAADRVVPQHLVLGHRRGQAGDGGHRRRRGPACEHPFLGDLELLARQRAGRHRADAAVLRERDQRRPGCTAPSRRPPYPKDGINDHVIHGAATVNPERRGTKCAFWYQLKVPPGGTVELRLRLRPDGKARARRGVRQDLRAGRWPPGAGRPTSSTPS